MTAEISTRVQNLVPSGVALLRQLDEGGAITPTSLDLLDPELTYERFEGLAAYLGSIKLSCSWWIGDLLNFGEKVYGETYAQAAELFGLTPETLQSYAYVCRAIARSRRRVELTFGHHRIVAPLEPKEQKKWLALAAENGWRRSDLKAALDASEQPPEPTEQPGWTPGLLDPPAPVEGSGAGSAGSPLAVLTSQQHTANGSGAAGATLTLVGNSTTAFADLVRRLVEEAIPQGHYVRVPRSTFDELAAFFAEE